jgi:actin cytoskeleton-regulatory complex protein SLA1
MGFIGVYRALYDYTPTGEDELDVREGDLLFVLERGDDDWWKAKKKAQSEDEEEPEGLIPSNYVEEVSLLRLLSLLLLRSLPGNNEVIVQRTF